MKTKVLFLVLCFVGNSTINYLFSQTKPRWITGKGTAQGTDYVKMRSEAISAARADALKQVGVELRAMDISLKTEAGQTLTDFYTQFAETETRGLILKERNVKVSHPKPLSDSEDVYSASYRIEISLEALVALQTGEPDHGFEVKLKTNRDVYQENEPVILTVTSTRDGFLTLFSVWNDSLTVIFPNSLSPDNFIKEDSTVIFPPASAGYSLNLRTIPSTTKSVETFIALVSKEEIPFSPIDVAKYEGKYLKLKQAMLTHYANWLYKIPINKRSSDARAVEVIKSEK